MPQSQTAANPRHQEEEKRDKNQRMQNKQTNAREAHRPALSSPIEVITMLKGPRKDENKKQGKTHHETPRSKIIWRAILWKRSIQSLKTADSVSLSLFMRYNGRCHIPDAA